jgi:uncharacterized membrane protein
MNQGMVTFESITDKKSRVLLNIVYEPEGVVETIGNETGAVSVRVKRALEKFKAYIESRGHETGAWRGTVKQS